MKQQNASLLCSQVAQAQFLLTLTVAAKVLVITWLISTEALATLTGST